jgi:hypothetical protein
VNQRARAARSTQDTTAQFARSSSLPTKPRTPPPRRFFELSSRSAAPSMSNPRWPRGGCEEAGWRIEASAGWSSRLCARGRTASTVAAVSFERGDYERTCAGYARPPAGRENIIRTASAASASAGRCGRAELRSVVLRENDADENRQLHSALFFFPILPGASGRLGQREVRCRRDACSGGGST